MTRERKPGGRPRGREGFDMTLPEEPEPKDEEPTAHEKCPMCDGAGRRFGRTGPCARCEGRGYL